MRKFMIERALPGIGGARREELKAVAQRSNEALRDLGPGIQWIESYVADNRTFCVYLAEDESLIRRHAEVSGFPTDKITEIKTRIDPSTASD
jgi:Nickel responsive protein SCO4226-like